MISTPVQAISVSGTPNDILRCLSLQRQSEAMTGHRNFAAAYHSIG